MSLIETRTSAVANNRSLMHLRQDCPINANFIELLNRFASQGDNAFGLLRFYRLHDCDVGQGDSEDSAFGEWMDAEEDGDIKMHECEDEDDQIPGLTE